MDVQKVKDKKGQVKIDCKCKAKDNKKYCCECDAMDAKAKHKK